LEPGHPAYSFTEVPLVRVLSEVGLLGSQAVL
jgi:hypothetical protein